MECHEIKQELAALTARRFGCEPEGCTDAQLYHALLALTQQLSTGRPAPAGEHFGARVFKVSQDEQGARLTWLRVTGGALKVKDTLSGGPEGQPWSAKADQLRQYAQFFFQPVVLYLYIKIAVVEHRLQFLGVSFGSVIVACQKTLGNGARDTCGQANQVFRMLAQ